MRQETREKKKPNLIIEIEDKPYSREDFIDCLAHYSAQLYKMSQIYQKSLVAAGKLDKV